jgi:hypothetical protein
MSPRGLEGHGVQSAYHCRKKENDMPAYIVLRAEGGQVRRVEHTGEIGLEQIYDQGLEPFDVAEVFPIPGVPDTRVNVLCHDEGLILHMNGKYGFEHPCWFMHRNSQPLYGPVILCNDDGEGALIPFTDEVAQLVIETLYATRRLTAAS